MNGLSRQSAAQSHFLRMSLDHHVCNRLVCCTQTVHKEFSEGCPENSREADLLFGASFFSYGDV